MTCEFCGDGPEHYPTCPTQTYDTRFGFGMCMGLLVGIPLGMMLWRPVVEFFGALVN